jgi:hypothetical protein
MGKLPGNLAKVPQFDNPLRPTLPTAKVLPIATDQPEAAPAPVANAAPAVEATEIQQPQAVAAAAEEALVHRMSVRFTDDQWKALQSECHRRRMLGEHINVAELLRILVDDWRNRS